MLSETESDPTELNMVRLISINPSTFNSRQAENIWFRAS